MKHWGHRPAVRGAHGVAALVWAVIAGTNAATAAGTTAEFCPEVYAKRVISLPFNPAFLHIEKFNTADGGQRDALLMSSFYNAIKNPAGTKLERLFQRDLVARITDLDGDPEQAPPVEIISDLDEVPRQVWPNETSRVPDGVVPFEAVVSPQGFQSAAPPGRLSLINLDDPQRTEYLVDQSSFQPPQCAPGSRDNQPWFYHDARLSTWMTTGCRTS